MNGTKGDVEYFQNLQRAFLRPSYHKHSKGKHNTTSEKQAVSFSPGSLALLDSLLLTGIGAS